MRNQDEIEVDGIQWKLHLPAPFGTTTLRNTAVADHAATTLHFVVNRDEEHISLRIQTPGQSVELPPRSAHYLLLVLARTRSDDKARGELPPAEVGWAHVDELSRMLRVDATKVNLDIFRIRRQMSELDLLSAEEIVERRRGTGQLRIGIANFEIAQG